MLSVTIGSDRTPATATEIRAQVASILKAQLETNATNREHSHNADLDREQYNDADDEAAAKRMLDTFDVYAQGADPEERAWQLNANGGQYSNFRIRRLAYVPPAEGEGEG